MPIRISTSSVVTLDDQGAIAVKNVNQDFDLAIGNTTFPQNTLVTPWAGRAMVMNLFEEIIDDPASQDEVVSVDFDRQTLNLILSQNGCEGIRFYFAKRDGRKTLVGFGIGNDLKVIGEEMFKKGFKIKADAPPPPGGEQGHGTTVRQLKALFDLKELVTDYNKVLDSYFTNTLR